MQGGGHDGLVPESGLHLSAHSSWENSPGPLKYCPRDSDHIRCELRPAVGVSGVERPPMKRKALLFFSGSLVALLTGSLAAILPARRAIGGATLAVGANAHVLWPTYTDTDRTNVLNRVAEAGLRMLRVDLDWDWVEYEGRGMRDTGPGSAYASLSGFGDQARARGISILIVVKGTPGWANGGQGPRVPPTDARDYGNFMGWLAGQLHGRAAAYELWNEPNSASFFTGTAAQYVALVKAAGPATQGAGPQASVVVGATQPYLALTFLTAAYDAGLASATFDAVSHHPYADPSDAPPEQDSPNPDVISLPGVARLRALMDRYGDSRPIWLTEWGYSSHTNSGTEPPWSRGVTLAQQADYLSRAVSYTRQYLPYVAVSLWYKERDTNTDN